MNPIDEQMRVAASVMELELRQHKLIVAVKPLLGGDGPKTWNFSAVSAMGTKSSKIRSLDEELAERLHAEGVQIFRRRGVHIISAAKPRNLWRTVTTQELDWALRRFQVQLRHGGQIPVGLDVLGEPVIVDIAEAVHVGIVGISGSGKTNLLHHMLVWMAAHSRPDALRIVYAALDKPEDLRPFRHTPHMAIEPVSDPDQILRALYELDRFMRRRQQVGETRPRMIVCIDEVQDLVARVPDADELLDALGRRGRSAGINLILGTQRATLAGLSRAASNIGQMLIGRTRSSADAALALGHSTKEAHGIRPHMLLGAGDFVCVAGGMSTRLQVPLLKRRDYVVMPHVDVPDWMAAEDLPDPPPAAPRRKGGGGWNAAEVDEAAIVEAFRDGASVNAVQKEYGISWQRAKRIQEQALANSQEEGDDSEEDSPADYDVDDSSASSADDDGEG